MKKGWFKFKSFKIKYPKTKVAIKRPRRLLFSKNAKKEKINMNKITRMGNIIEIWKLRSENWKDGGKLKIKYIAPTSENKLSRNSLKGLFFRIVQV